MGGSPIREYRVGKEQIRWSVRVIENTEQLHAGGMLDKLVALAIQVFNTNEDFLRNRLSDIIKRGGKIYYITDESGQEIFGFSTLHKPVPNDPIYATIPSTGDFRLGMSVVATEHLSKGIYRTLTRARVAEVIAQKIEKIELDTQNPRVEFSVSLALEEFKQRHEIKEFRVERIQGVRPNQAADTAEPPMPSGNPAIDEHYAKLNREKGEYYRLTFSLVYP